jgi:transposase
MDESTSLLFGLDSFCVVDVVRVADRVVRVVIETVGRQGVCPDCGATSTRVKDRSLVRIRDLPAADQQVALWWRKRRLACLEAACPRRSFTQATNEIPPRSRLTGRLRVRLAEAGRVRGSR